MFQFEWSILPTFDFCTFFCNCGFGALLFCPCLFHPSDNVWRSRCADAPQCAHFSTVIPPSCIKEQISVGKCKHRGASVRRECQISFKIVPWTKQTWKKHHNTLFSPLSLHGFQFGSVFPFPVNSLAV